MMISHRTLVSLAVAVAVASFPAVGALGVEHWSVDFQGVGGPLFGQEDPPVLMSGPDPVLGLGNVWNAFDVDGHDLPAMEDPSLTLVDSDGAASSVEFAFTGFVSAFSNAPGGDPLYKDYVFANAGNADPDLAWSITGLTAGETYDMINYGGVARSVSITVDMDGNGSLGNDTAQVAPASGAAIYRGITADAAGRIIGDMAVGAAREENWSGFQLLKEIPERPPVETVPMRAGDVIKLDFSNVGDADGGDLGDWNQTTSATALISPDGVVRHGDGAVLDGVSISFEGGGGGFNNDPVTADWFGTDDDPYYVLGADDIYFGPGPLTTTFRGLNDSFTYNVRVYNLIGNNPAAVEQFTVTDGAGTQEATSFRGDRWDALTLEEGNAVFSDLSTDGAGNIAVTVENTEAGGGYYPLNAIVLESVPAEGGVLQPGDADMDLDFDTIDLVQVQIANKYLSGEAATWGEGDWNGGPGGQPGDPPAGDGVFDPLDIIAALTAGKYLTGPYAAVAGGGQEGDGQTSVGYDAATGELWVDAPAGTDLTSINIDSAAGVFTGDAAQNLGGSFDNDSDDNIFKATFGSSFSSLSFGDVAQAGLSREFVLNDLTVVGSLDGGGDLGDVDLIYVPEPASCLLLVLGASLVILRSRRLR